MKRYFPGKLPSQGSPYQYSAYTGFSFEDTELRVYSPALDYYWAEHISAEEIYAAPNFGDAYGKALRGLLDAVWEQEDHFLRGYH
jgi:hypothetical protein